MAETDDQTGTDDGAGAGDTGKGDDKQGSGQKSADTSGRSGARQGDRGDQAKRSRGDTTDLDDLRQQIADLEADRDGWKKRSRQNEDQAKRNRDDAAAKATVEEQLTALRKDIADRDASDIADKATLAGERLQAALVRGGLSDDDADTLVATIDTHRLLTDGKPDPKSIKKLAESLAKIGGRPAPDRDQGRKGGQTAPDMNTLIRRAAGHNKIAG